jgi:predicted nucleic acid-binding protein
MAGHSTFVLDTFALLAYLQDEPGAARVETLLENASREKCRLFVSIINLGEMLYIIERRNGVAVAQDALALIRQLPIEILPADEQMVFAAAHIKASHALSYADAFAVAAAAHEGAVILTSDPEFKSIESLAAIEWLES